MCMLHGLIEWAMLCALLKLASGQAQQDLGQSGVQCAENLFVQCVAREEGHIGCAHSVHSIHGHRTLKAPHPVRSAKLTRVPPS